MIKDCHPGAGRNTSVREKLMRGVQYSLIDTEHRVVLTTIIIRAKILLAMTHVTKDVLQNQYQVPFLSNYL